MQTQSTVIETHSGRQKQSEFLPVTSEMLSTVDKTDVAEVSMNVQEAIRRCHHVSCVGIWHKESHKIDTVLELSGSSHVSQKVKVQRTF